MSRKKGFMGVLIIGAVALVALLGLFFVSPSCAGAASDAGEDDAAAPVPAPVIDQRAVVLEATAQVAVAATVVASTAFTARDIESTVAAALATRESESAMEPEQRSRVFGPEVAGNAVTVFGPPPVFGDDWVGDYGVSGACSVPEGRFTLPCPEGWVEISDEYSLSYIQPDGLAWLSAGWIDAVRGVDAETRLADLPAEAAGWMVYEFFGRSDVVSHSGQAGVRLDYGRQVVAEHCAERVSEIWYEVGNLVYLVTYGYCRDSWEKLGGYQDAVVRGVTFGGFP